MQACLPEVAARVGGGEEGVCGPSFRQAGPRARRRNMLWLWAEFSNPAGLGAAIARCTSRGWSSRRELVGCRSPCLPLGVGIASVAAFSWQARSMWQGVADSPERGQVEGQRAGKMMCKQAGCGKVFVLICLNTISCSFAREGQPDGSEFIMLVCK